MISTLYLPKLPLNDHFVTGIRPGKILLILLYTRRNPDKYDVLSKKASMMLIYAGIHPQQALNLLETIPSNADRLMGRNLNEQQF